VQSGNELIEGPCGMSDGVDGGHGY
jgi:hypothetical protein